MPFVKKNFLCVFLFFIINVQINYAQETIAPQLLLKNTENGQEIYSFYSFENNSLSLYVITKDLEYSKIWEYNFLAQKKAEPISVLYADIKGDANKELMALHKTKKELSIEKGPSQVTNQAGFIGSTAELQKLLKVKRG